MSISPSRQRQLRSRIRIPASVSRRTARSSPYLPSALRDVFGAVGRFVFAVRDVRDVRVFCVFCVFCVVETLAAPRAPRGAGPASRGARFSLRPVSSARRPFSVAFIGTTSGTDSDASAQIHWILVDNCPAVDNSLTRQGDALQRPGRVDGSRVHTTTQARKPSPARPDYLKLDPEPAPALIPARGPDPPRRDPSAPRKVQVALVQLFDVHVLEREAPSPA